jgi:hypothetical protein
MVAKAFAIPLCKKDVERFVGIRFPDEKLWSARKCSTS